MSNFKKIFFLVLLVGLVIAPQTAKGATTAVAISEYGPTTISTIAGEAVDLIIKITTGDGTVNPVTTTVSPTTAGTTGAAAEIYEDVSGLTHFFKVRFTSATGADATTFTITATSGSITSAAASITRVANFTKIKLAGQRGCDGNDVCAKVMLDGAEKELVCERNMCVPQKSLRAIGTICDSVQQDAQCRGDQGGFDFTCDNDDYCVGSVANVACMNDSQTVNKYLLLGKVYAQMDSSDRCDTGLYCDPGEGSCQNDFGQGKIPADKLGETADDIRDQIRNIINIALGFLGVAGVIVTIYGGALWMSAAGDDEKVGKAKKTIVSGLIGLVIIGVAWTIVSYVLTITQDIG